MTPQEEERRALERIVELIRESQDPVGVLKVAMVGADLAGSMRKQPELERARRDFQAVLTVLQDVSPYCPPAAGFVQMAQATGGQTLTGEVAANTIRLIADRSREIAKVAGDRFHAGEAPLVVLGRFPVTHEQMRAAFQRFGAMRAELTPNPEAEAIAFQMAITGLLEQEASAATPANAS